MQPVLKIYPLRKAPRYSYSLWISYLYLGLSLFFSGCAKQASKDQTPGEDSSEQQTVLDPNSPFSAEHQALCQEFHSKLDTVLGNHFNPKFRESYKPYALAMGWHLFWGNLTDENKGKETEKVIKEARAFAKSSDGESLSRKMKDCQTVLKLLPSYAPEGATVKLKKKVKAEEVFFQYLRSTLFTVDGPYSMLQPTTDLLANEKPSYGIGVQFRYFTGGQTRSKKRLPYLKIDYLNEGDRFAASRWPSNIKSKFIKALGIEGLSEKHAAYDLFSGGPQEVSRLMDKGLSHRDLNKLINYAESRLKVCIYVADSPQASSADYEKHCAQGYKTSSIPAAYGRILRSPKNVLDIAYLKLGTFYKKDAIEGLLNAWVELLKQSNQLHHLIVDLRGNGGGYLSENEHLHEYFLQEGTVANKRIELDEDLNPKLKLSRVTAERSSFSDIEHMLILVDHKSASAAEISSAVLRHYKKALVLGSQNTYGKFIGGELFLIEEGKIDGLFSRFTSYFLMPDNTNHLYQANYIDHRIADPLAPKETDISRLKQTLTDYNFYAEPSIPQNPDYLLDISDAPDMTTASEPELISDRQYQALKQNPPDLPPSCDPKADWSQVNPANCMLDAALRYMDRLHAGSL